MSPSVVSRLWRRYQETGEYIRRHGQCRSRMTTPRQDCFLVLLSRRNRIGAARALEIDFGRLPMFACPTRLLGIDSMMMV